LAGDFLADHQAAHRGREHGGELKTGESRQEQFGQAADGVHALANLRALEIVAAMQAGTQNEVAGEQRLRVFENIEHFLLLGIHRCGPTLRGAG